MEGLEHAPLKFVLIGESGVGKSSLLRRFVDDTFSASFIATIGIDFKVKTVTLSQNDQKFKVKVQVWDTAGQERFRTITNAYYRGAEAVVLVYDVTDKHSFNKLSYWMDEVTEHTTNRNPIKVVVGNKTDDVDKRQITKEEGKEFVEKKGYLFFEASSLSGDNVNDSFMEIAQRVFKQREHKVPFEETVTLIDVPSGSQPHKKSCC